MIIWPNPTLLSYLSGLVLDLMTLSNLRTLSFFVKIVPSSPAAIMKAFINFMKVGSKTGFFLIHYLSTYKKLSPCSIAKHYNIYISLYETVALVLSSVVPVASPLGVPPMKGITHISL